jgi:hypothetical protein
MLLPCCRAGRISLACYCAALAGHWFFRGITQVVRCKLWTSLACDDCMMMASLASCTRVVCRTAVTAPHHDMACLCHKASSTHMVAHKVNLRCCLFDQARLVITWCCCLCTVRRIGSEARTLASCQLAMYHGRPGRLLLALSNITYV